MTFKFSTSVRVGHPDTPGSRKILQAAKRLFIREGGGSFSSRGVAKEARLSLGAVQHFFPSKHLLLAAMLEYVVNEYENAYQRMCERLPMNGEARLLGVIDILISDIWNPQTRKFFFGFWALASHNPAAAGLFREMYAFHIKRIGAFLGAARPGLTERRCRDLALQIAAMIEGLMLFTAPRGGGFITRKRMSQLVKDTILDLLAAH